MSFYNMLFGKNPQSAFLLAVLGLKEHDVPRFRDVSVAEREGKPIIAVYTRMGGGNRGHWDSYDGEGGENCECPGCSARWMLAKLPGYLYDEDDDYDSTYATYYYAVPDEFADDIKGLANILANGLRKEFGEFLLQTLQREPTEADKSQAAYDDESQKLKRTEHFMANGHTFVPKDDWSMRTALELAEANGGKLRSCWGIMPLKLTFKQNSVRWLGAKDITAKFIDRQTASYEWKIDIEYWAHCQELFMADFPVTIAKIAEGVANLMERS